MRPEGSVKAGGVDMPPKTDPHDWTTPSGQVPVVIHMPLWKQLEKAGWDMRWYVVARPIPVSGR